MFVKFFFFQKLTLMQRKIHFSTSIRIGWRQVWNFNSECLILCKQWLATKNWTLCCCLSSQRTTLFGNNFNFGLKFPTITTTTTSTTTSATSSFVLLIELVVPLFTSSNSRRSSNNTPNKFDESKVEHAVWIAQLHTRNKKTSTQRKKDKSLRVVSQQQRNH